MISTQTPKPRLFTPLSELRRYGWHWPDALLCLCWAVAACALTFLVPFGFGNDLQQFLRVHVTLFGFGATVFGFTILGGKDDFFEPIIAANDNGADTLRNMVLFLFTPLALQGLACIVLVARILFPCISHNVYSAYAWRFGYSFTAIWAAAQTGFSYRFLFVLAITRIVWKNRDVKKRRAAKEQQEKDIRRKEEGTDATADKS